MTTSKTTKQQRAKDPYEARAAEFLRQAPHQLQVEKLVPTDKPAPDFRVTTTWGYCFYAEVKSIRAFAGQQEGGRGVLYQEFNRRLSQDLKTATKQLAEVNPSRFAGNVIILVSDGHGPHGPYSLLAALTGRSMNPFTGEMHVIGDYVRAREAMKHLDLVVYLERGAPPSLMFVGDKHNAHNRKRLCRAFALDHEPAPLSVIADPNPLPSDNYTGDT